MCKKIGKCKEYAFLKFPGHVYSEKVLFNDAEFESKPLILRRSGKKVQRYLNIIDEREQQQEHQYQ